jgi:uncharacterized protein (UPF0335 family)
MQSNTVLDFEQTVCSLEDVEKCVKNKNAFANAIIGKGKGAIPAKAARMVQVLTIGSFTHCIMEKFVEWQGEIEESFKVKARTCNPPALTSDDNPSTVMAYWAGKKLLCSQIRKIIGSSCGGETITPAIRKKNFFKSFGMDYITRVLLVARSKPILQRKGYEFMERIEQLEERVQHQLMEIQDIKMGLQGFQGDVGNRNLTKKVHFPHQDEKKKPRSEREVGDTKAVAAENKLAALRKFLDRIDRLEEQVKEHDQLIRSLKGDIVLEKEKTGDDGPLSDTESESRKKREDPLSNLGQQEDTRDGDDKVRRARRVIQQRFKKRRSIFDSDEEETEIVFEQTESVSQG